MKDRIKVTGGTLKCLAIITMLIDHIGAVILYRGLWVGFGENATAPISLVSAETHETLYNLYYILRGIGRLSFPIFCFLLVEGFLHTKNVQKYAVRLFLFGLLSEVPFDLAIRGVPFSMDYQNVMFTLFIGLMVLIGLRRSWDGSMEDVNWKSVFGVLLSLGCGCAAAGMFKTDYSYKGILLIAVIYLFRSRRDVQCLTGAAATFWENWAFLAFIPIYFYNGERGRQSKYLFYVIYPLHLLVYYAIARWGISALLGIA